MATIFAALAVSSFPAVVAGATDPARLGLTPLGQPGLYFDLTMAPGETRDLRVEVANFGGQPIRARTYAANAYSIVNGGFGAALFGAEPTGTVRWLDYPTQELNLKPGDAIAVDFRVRVPDATQPGQYITSRVAENAEPNQGSSGSITFNQVNRIAIAVAIDIPGPRQPVLKIGDVAYKFAGGISSISFGIANPGNVHLKPAGTFVLRDAARGELVRTAVTMDSVYAMMATRLEVALAEPLRPGDYCAELRLTDPATKASDSTATCQPFTVGPPPVAATQGGGGFRAGPLVQEAIDAATAQPLLALLLVLVIVAILSVIGVLIVVLVRRRRRRLETPPPGSA